MRRSWRRIEFQVDRGATTIIPPYFYAEHPHSPAFAASLAAIGRTARRMRVDGVSLPLMPLLCVQLRGFTAGAGWQRTLDRFVAAAIEVGPQAIALYLSPLGNGRESYAKLLYAHDASYSVDARLRRVSDSAASRARRLDFVRSRSVAEANVRSCIGCK